MEIKEGEVYTYKLIGGQEIVAKAVSEDDEYYHVSAGLTLGQGPKGPGFMPVIATAEAVVDFPIRKSAVSIVVETREDIAKAYKESIDPSGIITPEPKQIITG